MRLVAHHPLRGATRTDLRSPFGGPNGRERTERAERFQEDSSWKVVTPCLSTVPSVTPIESPWYAMKGPTL